MNIPHQAALLPVLLNTEVSAFSFINFKNKVQNHSLSQISFPAFLRMDKSPRALFFSFFFFLRVVFFHPEEFHSQPSALRMIVSEHAHLSHFPGQTHLTQAQDANQMPSGAGDYFSSTPLLFFFPALIHSPAFPPSFISPSPPRSSSW